MKEIVIAVVPAALAAVAAIISAYIAAHSKAAEKRSEARAARREEESRLSMEMLSANMDLAFVTSLAVTGGHTNGNVEAAQKRAAAAQEKYEKFLREQAAHQVCKI